MKVPDIISARLHNQLLSQKRFNNAGEVVGWFGAIQSQDFEGSKWAIGQRIENSTEKDIQQAFDKGEIIRTHVLRPTWHFVSPADIKWMLALTASRIKTAIAPTFRQVQLTDKILKASNTAIVKALQKGNPLTRNELRIVLQQKGIRTDDIRMICLLMHAETDGLICSGPKHGNQFTYMLLDERAPAPAIFKKDEALVELAKRYFNSHSPATVNDFAWWSGLSVTDAKKAVESIKSHLLNEKMEKEVYWFFGMPEIKAVRSLTHLLPAFDEYTVAYKTRHILLHPGAASQSSMGMLNPLIVLKGKVIGTWKRMLYKKNVTLETTPFIPLSPSANKSILSAAKRYAKFIESNLSFNMKKTLLKKA